MKPEVLSLRAPDLKKRFGVYGHFYELKLGNHYYPARSVLELIHHDVTPHNLEELADCSPDIVVAMMNPGSSRPLDDGYQPIQIDQVTDIARHREWVPAQPDTTQYQIMRVMASRGWHHARIINLSDLREPKSGRFLETVEYLDTVSRGGGHSIFDPRRRGDLQYLMGTTGRVPVVLGWGRDPGLSTLAKQALEALEGWSVAGVPADEEGRLFAHPSPMLQRHKDAWLMAIDEVLNARRLRE
jgi:hypothetical protein